LCCTTNQRSIPFGYLLHLLVHSHQGRHLLFSGVFVAEEVDGVGDKGSGDITLVDMATLLEASLNISLIFARFIDDTFFLLKNKTSDLGTALVKCWNIGIFKL
jgi:hypothetical protein